MWEDILKKDTLIEIISKFMFLETKDEEDELTGKIKHKETLIFPRYHQLDVIRARRYPTEFDCSKLFDTA